MEVAMVLGVLKSRYGRMQRSSIPFIDNGRTRRPLTPIKYMDKTVSTIDSDNTKEYIKKLKINTRNTQIKFSQLTTKG